MFKKLSLRIKLLLSFSVVSLTLVAVGLANYVSLNKVVEDYKHISDVNLPNSIHLSDMYRYAMALKYLPVLWERPIFLKTKNRGLLKNIVPRWEILTKPLLHIKKCRSLKKSRELFEAFEKSFKAFETSTSTMMKLGSTGNPADLQKNILS